MEHILNSFNNNRFYNSCISFFEKLNIPISKITSLPIAVNDIFSKPKPAFSVVKDIYVIGMVNDDSFASTTSTIDYKHKKAYDGILVFGVELNIDNPTRSQLSEISRAFNREYHYTPVIIIFKYGNKLSFSNTQRQEYKIAKEGEKAGKVSILRDVDIDHPHRGHIDILESMKKTSKVKSYETLYQHWQEVFDVSILNKAFYKELSDWYFWTLKENNVNFPNAPKGLEENAATLRHEHNAKNVIRLLTRLLFVWFMKEKGLVPNELFEEDYIKNNLLKEFNPKKAEGLFANSDSKSKYYKAVLQNLFFATLNQEMGKRAFRTDKQHRNITNLMRYEKYFSNPQEFIDLVESIVPFMNGGLFECLDKPHPTQKGRQGGEVIVYEDGFSDRPDNELVVPDYIFFGLEQNVDLSSEYGSKSKAYKNVKVKGLINILNSYKFTVAENTPIDEDVALDPELLGKVFENLLASYNPETKTTARKQTGSFYTPREIVSYMVDESLIAYLKTILEDYKDKEELDEKLHQLLAYDDIQPFNDKKVVLQIINAIDSVKILDPAVGSGAFPMGTLQKMVHLLHKLDPENEHWQNLQIEKAKKETSEVFKTEDKKQREERLLEINDAFDITINHPDYARKLYIIENSIFGVDIQPIAIQISKLRFFISLVVEQNVNNDKPNFGIRPLPNLESKFVAANTLIDIEKEEANLFDKKEIKKLEDELKIIRHKLFNARTQKTKRKLRAKDKELREQISKKLIENGLANNTAKQLASWDPYDQNENSPFFDMEWMFGIEEGFDIVIGNPPYVQIKQIPWKDRKYFEQHYFSAQGRFNLFYFFIERAASLTKKNGVVSFIIPDRLLLNTQCKDLRGWLLNEKQIIEMTSFNESVFDSAVVDNIILVYKNCLNNYETITVKYNISPLELSLIEGVKVPIGYYNDSSNKQFDLNFDLDKSNLMNKIKNNTKLLGDIAEIKDGIIQGKIPDVLFLKNKVNNSCKKILFGKDINRYELNYHDNWVDYRPDEMMNLEVKRRGEGVRHGLWLRTPEIFEREKILTRQTADEIIATFDDENYYYANTLHGTTITNTNFDKFYVLAIMNSKLITWYYRSSTAEEGKVFAQIKIALLKLLPIKNISKKEQQPYIDLVDKILDKKKKDEATTILENQLDNMIYELYGLNDDEIKMIENT